MPGRLAVEITLCCDFFDTMHTRSMQKSNILHCTVIGVTVIALQQGLRAIGPQLYVTAARLVLGM